MSQSPFVPSFQGSSCISTSDFVKIFRQFDVDGNGYIEKSELDHLIQALYAEMQQKGNIDKAQLQQMKEMVMNKYDVNSDGKISMDELSMILPTESNFIATFQQHFSLSSVEFIKVWYHYDKDRSGYIEINELEGFVADLLRRQTDTLTPQRLKEKVDVMTSLFDKNKDGKIDISELQRLLPVDENPIKAMKSCSQVDTDALWKKYEKDGSGFIEGHELDAFLHDLGDSINTVSTTKQIETMKGMIMAMFDANKDGKLNKAEFDLIVGNK